MQNLSKRQWKSSLSVKEAGDTMIEWCIRAREKNVIRKKPPQLFYAYVVSDCPPLQHLHNISAIFKYSQKDVPYIDQSRDSLLRCLSVALKAHFFLFSQDKVSHEPYYFTIPSLLDSNQTTFGLIYHIEQQNKTIIVCEKDIAQLFTSNNILMRFPTIVMEDSFKWYHMKNWARIKHQVDSKSIITNEEEYKKFLQITKSCLTKEELEQHATILEIPYEIKDDIKPLGVEWSSKVKVWYLPKGFDIDTVNHFIDYKKREAAKIQKEIINK
jgi:hypothetical protein